MDKRAERRKDLIIKHEQKINKELTFKPSINSYIFTNNDYLVHDPIFESRKTQETSEQEFTPIINQQSKLIAKYLRGSEEQNEQVDRMVYEYPKDKQNNIHSLERDFY